MTKRRIVIEQAGFIGTASGKFHISKPVAYAVRDADYDEWGAVQLRNARSLRRNPTVLQQTRLRRVGNRRRIQ